MAKISAENGEVLQTSDAKSTLRLSLAIMTKIARWLIRSGVGYTEFAAALKSIFYKEALKEAERIGKKSTDSSISLLSGLHRRDVNTLKNNDINDVDVFKAISVPAQVIAQWVHRQLPSQIPYHKAEVCFEGIVKSISTDLHPRSVLSELERVGILFEKDGQVFFSQNAFVPNQQSIEIKEMVAHSVVDHLAAGLHNMYKAPEQTPFLEQSVCVDHITEQHAAHLVQYSAQLWHNYANKLLEEAIRCSDLDKQKNEQEAGSRFRFGTFNYHLKNDDLLHMGSLQSNKDEESPL